MPVADLVKGIKLCSRCRVEQSIVNFGKAKRCPDGLSRWCRRCQAEYDKGRDQEKNRQRAREWYHKSPENMARGRAKAQQWYQDNPERHSENVLQWREKNAELCLALHRAVESRRRAQKRLSPVIPYTLHQLSERMSMFGYACWVCHGSYEQVDHVKPLARGGWDILANLRPICGYCNRKKAATWPFEPRMILVAA